MLTDKSHGGIEEVADVRYFLRQLEPGLMVWNQEEPIVAEQEAFSDLMSALRWSLIAIEAVKPTPLLRHGVDRFEERAKAGQGRFLDLITLTFLVEDLLPGQMVRQIAERYEHLQKDAPYSPNSKARDHSWVVSML